MFNRTLHRNFSGLTAFATLYRVVLPSFVILAFVSPFAASALDWPRWRGPDFNGIAKETGWSTSWPNEGPKQLWKANVGAGFSSISVSNGRAYTVGNRNNQDTIYCFDASTGAELWKHSYPAPLDDHYYDGGSSATPTVDGDNVYHLARRGGLFCLNAATGKIVWSKDLHRQLGLKIPEWGFASSPLVEGDLLIVNAGSAGTALDKATGQVVWTSGKGSAGYSSAVPFSAGNERYAALFLAESVAAVNVKTGKELWWHTWKTSYDVNAADPIISGNEVFISSGYNKGAGLLRIMSSQPNVVWQNKNMRNHFNSCVLVDGNLYGFDESELKCLDWKTGALKWDERNLGKGALTAADGKLIVQGERGQLVIAEATPVAFEVVARAQVLGGTCWTTPVLASGKIYCRNANGDLVCVDVSGRQTAQ